jgi:hypothetical protein
LRAASVARAVPRSAVSDWFYEVSTIITCGTRGTGEERWTYWRGPAS